MVGFFARPVGNLDVSEGQNVVYTEVTAYFLSHTSFLKLCRLSLEFDMSFSQVLTNYGEAYSANSGFFTAPVNGLYLFSAFMQVCQIYVERKL